MSLALIQGYSSTEEEEEVERFQDSDEEEEDDEENNEHRSRSRRGGEKPLFDPPPPPKSTEKSLLPSALDVFSEIAGPPEFLNNCVAEHVPMNDNNEPRGGGRRGWHKNRREKKDLPTGVVVEAKAQLVGIRDRVRSDIDGNHPPASASSSQKGSMNTGPGEGKRVVSATIPDAKDAADLLRMCLQCGIPKTFSNARGMVCPVCGDRPPIDSSESDKKKGSTVKDKEKNKRMKGQSSHATWKSETEMQLRQQFD